MGTKTFNGWDVWREVSVVHFVPAGKPDRVHEDSGGGARARGAGHAHLTQTHLLPPGNKILGAVDWDIEKKSLFSQTSRRQFSLRGSPVSAGCCSRAVRVGKDSVEGDAWIQVSTGTVCACCK